MHAMHTFHPNNAKVVPQAHFATTLEFPMVVVVVVVAVVVVVEARAKCVGPSTPNWTKSYPRNKNPWCDCEASTTRVTVLIVFLVVDVHHPAPVAGAQKNPEHYWSWRVQGIDAFLLRRLRRHSAKDAHVSHVNPLVHVALEQYLPCIDRKNVISSNNSLSSP